MPFARRGRELGVELNRQEPGMRERTRARELDDFGERFGRRTRRDFQARRLEPAHVVVIDFVTVPMALVDRLAIYLSRQRTAGDRTALRPQAHGAAQIGGGVATLHPPLPVLPFRDETHDRMSRGGVELSAVSPCQTADIAGKFNHGELHPQADAQIGDARLAGVPNGRNFSFHTPTAKTPWNQDGVKPDNSAPTPSASIRSESM